MYVVVSYDIVEDKKRSRASKLLKNYGQRVQKSVFECLMDEKRYLEVKAKLEKIIDMENDSVRFYTICRRCRDMIEISGWGTVLEEEDVVVV